MIITLRRVLPERVERGHRPSSAEPRRRREGPKARAASRERRLERRLDWLERLAVRDESQHT